MGKTISPGIVVGVSAQTSEFRREMSAVNRILASVRDPAQDMVTQLQLLNQKFEGKEKGQAYSDAVSKIGVQASKATERLAKMRAEFNLLNDQGVKAAAEKARQVQLLAAAQATSQKFETPNQFFGRGLKDLKDQFSTGALGVREFDAAVDELTQAANLMDPAFNRMIADNREFAKSEEAARQATIKQTKALVDQAAAHQQGVRQRATQTQNRFSPVSFFREGRGDLETQFASGRLSARSLRLALAELADQARALNPALQRAAQGAAFLQQFENAQQRLSRQLQEADRLHRRGALSTSQHAQAIAQLQRQASLAHQSFAAFKTGVVTLLGPLVLLVSAFQAFKSAVNLSAQLDQSRAKLRVFTGSIFEAERILKSVRKLSADGPVNFAGGQRAITTLLQFGVTNRDVLPSFKAIAEITAGDTERMENLSLAFAQSAAAGRLMGQELLQMVNAGFNPLKVISEQTGRSLVDLKEDMSKGLISFDQVKKAFKDATSEGGKFNGLLNEIAGTTAGKLAKAQSRLQELGIAFGDLIKPATNEALDLFSSNIEAINRALAAITAGGAANDPFQDVVAGLLRIANKSGLSQLQLAFDQLRQEFLTIEDDTKEFLDTFDRLNVNTSGLNKRLFSAQSLKEIEEYRKALEEVADLIDKARLGDKLTSVETDVVDDERKRLRAEKKIAVGRAEAIIPDRIKSLTLPDKLIDQQRKLVELVEEVGQGFFDDNAIARYEKAKVAVDSLDEATKRLAATQERLQESIGEPARKVKDQVADLKFGKDANGNNIAENIRLAAGGLEPRDQKAINDLVDMSRTLQEFDATPVGDLNLDPASYEAAAKALEDLVASQTELNRLQKQDDFEKELVGLRQKIELQKNLALLGEQEARRIELQNDKKLGLNNAQAVEQAQLEKDLKDATREAKSTEEVKDLEKKIQHQKDLVNLTKEEAAVRKLMADGLSLANAEAQARAEKDLEDATRSATAKEELKDLAKKVQYQQDLLKFTKEVAEIRSLVADDFSLGEATAKAELTKRENDAKDLVKLKEDAKGVNEDQNPLRDFIDKMVKLTLQQQEGFLNPGVFAAEKEKLLNAAAKDNAASASSPVVSQGSQDAFRALTSQTVDRVNAQLQESQKQTILLETANEINRKLAERLIEIANAKVKRVGP